MNRVSLISRSHPARADAADGSAAHRYWAFLSYSHKDNAQADWLHEALEHYRVPKALVGRLTATGPVPASFAPIFRDREELAASGDLGHTIRQALTESRCLIVLCSPDAAKSRWTNEEILAFKKMHPNRLVLAAIVAGEPFASEMPGREAEECFPSALRQRFDRRGRPTGKRAEPIAADLRDRGDGKEIGLVKLVAGMLGLGLDDLVKREQTRRQRRMSYIAAASVAGMTLASGLAFFAFDARDAARDQRREAEGLVAFMLGDLKDKLEPIGKLDALDGVGSRVLEYYSKQDASELSDAALLQRARALSLTGQVAYLRGNFDGAARLYREAMAGTAEAVRRDPDDPKRLFDHAQNVFWVGDLERQLGRIGEAEAAYREYKRLADNMVAIEPDNLKWRMEVQYARENLGIVLFNQRRYSEAAAMFEGSLGPMESLASLDPRNSVYQRETGKLLNWVAQAQWVLGRMDSAISVRQRQVSFLERQLKDEGADVLLREMLVPARRALGLLFTSRGQAERGVQEFRLALAESKRLIAIEPNNSTWKEASAAVRLELASNLLSLGHRDEAAREIAAACAAAAALRARDPKVATWRALQTNCLDRRSRLALALGATAHALALAKQAHASARSERNADPVTDRYRVAAQARLLGDIRRRTGDDQGAAEAWSAGLAQLPAKVTERPWEMNERAELLRRLGRSNESRPIAERLRAIGYRNIT